MRRVRVAFVFVTASYLIQSIFCNLYATCDHTGEGRSVQWAREEVAEESNTHDFDYADAGAVFAVIYTEKNYVSS